MAYARANAASPLGADRLKQEGKKMNTRNRWKLAWKMARVYKWRVFDYSTGTEIEEFVKMAVNILRKR